MNETNCSIQNSPSQAKLYLAFELGNKEWKLGFSVGLGQGPRRRTVRAADLMGVGEEIGLAKKRFGLAETTEVMSCYEAGRDGFWLHRYLLEEEIENVVVDSASIEVNRRAKRAKADRLDVGKLLRMLIRYDSGEKKVWSVVRVLSVAAEDNRHLHRQLKSLKVERTRHINRLKGLLVSQGVRLSVSSDFMAKLGRVRLWDGSALLAGLRVRLEREYACLTFVNEHIQALETERRQVIRTGADPSAEQVRQLLRLRGIGHNSAWLFVMEFFSWRHFHNRREVGRLAGLAPTPYQSGDEAREQGGPRQMK